MKHLSLAPYFAFSLFFHSLLFLFLLLLLLLLLVPLSFCFSFSFFSFFFCSLVFHFYDRWRAGILRRPSTPPSNSADNFIETRLATIINRLNCSRKENDG